MRNYAGLCVCVSAFVILLTLSGHSRAQPSAADGAESPFLHGRAVAIEEGDDELLKLLKARYNEALAEMSLHHKYMRMGRGALPEEAGQRLLRAGLDLYERPEERVTFLEQYVEFAKSCEQQIDMRVEIGVAGMEEAHRARYVRIGAEIDLLRARREAGAASR